MEFIKGQAVIGFPFGLVNRTTGDAITTGSPVVFVTLDGLIQFTAGYTPVHEGNGQWTMNFTGAETLGDLMGFIITHTDAIPQHFAIKTSVTPTTVPVISVTVSAAGTSLVDNFEYYGTLPSADLYFDNRLDSDAWSDAVIGDRQSALIQATRAIDNLNYEGHKNDKDQTLQFPRVDDIVIPVEIEQATYELAIKFLEGIEQDIEIQTLGVMTESYSGVRTAYDPNYVNVHIRAGIPSITAWELLKPFLRESKQLLLSRVS